MRRPVSALAAVDRWYRPVAPPERLAAVRVLVGAFAVVWLLLGAPLHLAPLDMAARRFDPVGPVRWLSEPLPGGAVLAAWLASLPLGVAFVLGWRFRWTGPAFAALLLWVLSYRNSWGMVFHTENLLVLHTGVLALCAAADARSLDARGREPAAPDRRYGWPLRLLCAVTVGAYLLAALAKLRAQGWAWTDGEVLRTHVAFDNVRKLELGDPHAPLGAWLVGHGALWGPLAWGSLVLELGAPLALLHRRLGRAWVLGIWSFHLGVLLTMNILFLYPLAGVAFAAFFDAERLWHPRARGGRR